MSTAANPIIDALMREPLVDKNGNPSAALRRFHQELWAKTNQALTILGQIQAATKIQGRAEGIGTTVSKHDATGKLTDADQIAADGAAFVRVNPNQRTGGDRGFNALNSQNRLADTFRSNPVNTSNAPTSSTTLSNDGVSTVIPVAAATDNFGAGSISDNSGSVDPGVFGTFFVFHDDPNFAGGAVTYQFSSNGANQTAADGRINDGKVITVGGSAKTGGGSSGGSTAGGSGGRGYNVY